MDVTIAFVGDTHGHLRLMYEKLREYQLTRGCRIDYVFQVGDFGVWLSEEDLDPRHKQWATNHGISLVDAVGDFPSLVLGEWEIPIPTYFIRGNHEDQEFLLTHERTLRDRHPDDYLGRAATILPNLFYVPDSHIIDFDGTHVAGWGGCWGEKTWDMDYWGEVRAAKNQKGWARRLNHMTRDRFERLIREDFDILVTHDAPTGMGLRGRSNRNVIDPEIMTEANPGGPGVSYIRELIETRNPVFHFCGHWHQYKRCPIGAAISLVLGRVDPREPDGKCFQVVGVNR